MALQKIYLLVTRWSFLRFWLVFYVWTSATWFFYPAFSFRMPAFAGRFDGSSSGNPSAGDQCVVHLCLLTRMVFLRFWLVFDKRSNVAWFFCLLIKQNVTLLIFIQATIRWTRRLFLPLSAGVSANTAFMIVFKRLFKQPFWFFDLMCSIFDIFAG